MPELELFLKSLLLVCQLSDDAEKRRLTDFTEKMSLTSRSGRLLKATISLTINFHERKLRH